MPRHSRVKREYISAPKRKYLLKELATPMPSRLQATESYTHLFKCKSAPLRFAMTFFY